MQANFAALSFSPTLSSSCFLFVCLFSPLRGGQPQHLAITNLFSLNNTSLVTKRNLAFSFGYAKVKNKYGYENSLMAHVYRALSTSPGSPPLVLAVR